MKINELKPRTPFKDIIAEVEGKSQILKSKSGDEFIILRLKDSTGNINLECFGQNKLFARGVQVGDYIKLNDCYCKKWCDLEKIKGWDCTMGFKGKFEVL